MDIWSGSADKEDPNEIQIRELREALAQIKKEFEEANLAHARELAEVREALKKAKETHKREKNEVPSAIPPAQSIRVSHWLAPYLDLNDRNMASNLHKET